MQVNEKRGISSDVNLGSPLNDPSQNWLKPGGKVSRISQVLERVPFKKTTLYKLMKKECWPTVLIGKTRFIPDAFIDHWLEIHSQPYGATPLERSEYEHRFGHLPAARKKSALTQKLKAEARRGATA